MAHENKADRRGLEPALWAVVFFGLFVYIWTVIEPHLIYYGFGVFGAYPVFIWDGSFLWTILSTPGGALEAVAALLAQSYRFSWLGALTIVAFLGVLFLAIRRLLRLVQAGGLRDLALVPLLLAIVVYNRYENPLAVLLAVDLALGAAVLYDWLPIEKAAGRMASFFIAFVLVYYLAGAAAFVFVATACLIEAGRYGRWKEALLATLVVIVGTLALGRLAFRLDPRVIYTAATPWDPTRSAGFAPSSNWVLLVVYAFGPALMAVAFGGRALAKVWKRRRPTGRARKSGRWQRNDPRVWVGLRFSGVTVALVLCLLLSRTHIRYERALHYYAQQRDWDRVVALAHRMRGRHPFTRTGVFDINRALAHLGRLGDEMCAYPQDGTKTLFLSFEDMTGRLGYAKAMELYLDLGCLNAAEKNAYELLENEGPSPYILDSLVRIHLAKGQRESALVAFGALKKHVGGREYVRQWQAIMADPNLAAGSPRLAAWRAMKPTRDYAVMGIAFEPMLQSLLRDRPNHRLAYEYLMACYLLKHQRAQLAKYLPLLRSLGFQRLPKHYAEALLVHSLETQTPVEAYGWPIAPQLRQQFREIRGIVTKAKGNYPSVFGPLASKYGDTYTFYSMFNVCGVN